jgi:hypothetical protein
VTYRRANGDRTPRETQCKDWKNAPIGQTRRCGAVFRQVQYRDRSPLVHGNCGDIRPHQRSSAGRGLRKMSVLSGEGHPGRRWR